MRNIINDLAASAPAIDTPEGKVGAFYNAYLDTDAINASGLAPAQPYLDKIAAIETREDLARLFGTVGYASPINGFVWVDDKDPDTYIFQMSLGGLGMPDRDYCIFLFRRLNIKTTYSRHYGLSVQLFQSKIRIRKKD